ncbi:MAG: hypothetical protein AAF969_10290 [Bacteroidota bacterium]
MESLVINKIDFPEFTGVKCNMMPFIQGDSNSLPDWAKSYSAIVDEIYLEKGEVGFLTIDESFVNAGKSQRGYNAKGINRNVHIEVGRIENFNRWGGGGSSWGGKANTLLDDETKVLIANSISDTCRFWNTIEKAFTKDGDLSDYIERYPEETGILLKAGQLAKISIFTPHECMPQKQDGKRQFFRIVGKGVKGREPYFTTNPLIKHNHSI